jgi:hypothetical protein
MRMGSVVRIAPSIGRVMTEVGKSGGGGGPSLSAATGRVNPRVRASRSNNTSDFRIEYPFLSDKLLPIVPSRR